ncbi:MAG: nucleotidyltransferase family protein, partial [Chloroflexi bacterium]|nr:nucleotidyltransferase family protein [Chloroflexota bacterium]
TRLAAKLPVRSVHNPGYAQEGMISSIQCGLRAMSPERRGALVALGDQPQVRERTVRRIVAAFVKPGAALVVPSYQMQRGHPWLVSRALWPDLLALSPTQTGRDFLNAHADQILYLPAEDDSILRDLDTPEDYERQRPT